MKKTVFVVVVHHDPYKDNKGSVQINCPFMHLIFTPYLVNSQSRITRNSLLLLRIRSIELTKSGIKLNPSL